MAAPPWMSIAIRDIGTRETKGAKHTDKIVAYSRSVGADWVRGDETPWCAAFVGACLERCGMRSTRSLRARSYSDYGIALTRPVPGCIAVLSRGNNPAKGHVGFVVSANRRTVTLLGGNQSDRVSISSYGRDRLVALRWPENGEQPGEPGSERDFQGALSHVLKHEGGWSNDPLDPGGPTNRGITLSRFASHLGEKLDGSSRQRLIESLKTIAPSLVQEIYYERYWLVGQSHLLPAGLDLMHFDCAVNQGAYRAAKFLQSAVGAKVDGEIGPQTLKAAHTADTRKAIAQFRALRAAHYRGLEHFWRFGRGWLSRLKNTYESALAGVGDALPAGRHESPVQRTSKGDATVGDARPAHR